MSLKSRPLTDPGQIEDIQLRLSQGRVIALSILDGDGGGK